MEDTIVAIATPPGEGGIGVIRMSGHMARDLLEQVFVPYTGREPMPRQMTYGHLVEGEERNTIIDEAMAVFMPAPLTYTREDVVEIQCHGSMIPLKRTLGVLMEKGARLAEPGEFTKRAFLHGRLDLSQAEAVMDLVQAKTPAGFQVAVTQLKGATTEKIQRLLEKLQNILVQILVNIEYPEEDIEEVTYPILAAEVEMVLQEIQRLLDTAHGGRILKEGLRISIAGKPNVGKSSLLNALLGEERAIVTSVPGTTRDTIEEWVNIRNIPLRITDTAGIREAFDEVERMGIYRAKETFQKSDLVILVLDGSQPLSTEDQEIMTLLKNHATLVILNKRDLGEAVNHPQVAEHLPHARILEMSLTEGMGLSQLEETLEDMVYKGQAVAGEELIITQARHEELLGRAKAHLQDGLSAIQRKDALDFVEVDLKNAHQALGDILGITVKDDIIEEVFRRFCLGK